MAAILKVRQPNGTVIAVPALIGPPGMPGVGIRKITPKSSDETGNLYAVTLTDGSIYDLVVPTGPQGDMGPSGVHVGSEEPPEGCNVWIDPNGEPAQLIPGPQGEPGKDGVGVAKIELKSSDENGNTYTITLTNNKTYDFVAPPGPQGKPGPAYTLNDIDKDTIASAVKASLKTETWTFTLEDDSTVKKAVYVE